MKETMQNELFQDLISDLEQKVIDGSVQVEDFTSVLYSIKNLKYKIQSLLDIVQNKNEDLNKLYRAISDQSSADMVDDLYSLGYRHRKNNEKLSEAFEKMGYRIMEQARTGKRDDVFYSFLRIYMSENSLFDKKLLFAFRHPNDEMFKVLIFSFLSGIIDDKINKE